MRVRWSFGEGSLRFRSLVVAAVTLLHLVFYLVLAHGQAAPSAGRATQGSLRVEFIERAPRIERGLAAPPEILPAPALPVRRAGTARTTPRAKARSGTIPAADPPPEPLMLKWRESAGLRQEFQLRRPDDSFADPTATSEPERFRMRRQVSGEDVVEGAAQLLGLWPEGYTTDPCPRIKRNIGNLMTDARPEGRRALEEELRRQRAACRQ